MVTTYLASRPEPDAYDFLQFDFDELEARFGGVVATTFRTFPSFPQRYIEPLALQPSCEADADGARIQPLRLAAAAHQLRRRRPPRPAVSTGPPAARRAGRGRGRPPRRQLTRRAPMKRRDQ